MKQTRLLSILQLPHVTEKTSLTAGQYRQYAFKVLPDANKFEVRQAVEKYLNVKVRKVQICRVKGKTKRAGRTKDWKKAYVVLEQNQEIDLTKSEG
jgi:large subunit ribosomal protein L23